MKQVKLEYEIKVLLDPDPVDPREEAVSTLVMDGSLSGYSDYTEYSEDQAVIDCRDKHPDDMRHFLDDYGLVVPIYGFLEGGATILSTSTSTSRRGRSYIHDSGFMFFSMKWLRGFIGDDSLEPGRLPAKLILMVKAVAQEELDELNAYINKTCYLFEIYPHWVDGVMDWKGALYDDCEGFYSKEFCRKQAEEVVALLLKNPVPEHQPRS